MSNWAFYCIICAFQIQSYNAPYSTIFKVANGTIQFKSIAPLELIKATSNNLSGLFDTQKKTFAFKVPVNTFTGFNGLFQKEHFNENYMETEKFPYADFKGKLIEDIDYTKEGNYTIRAKGNLTIHGITQERILKIDIIIKKNQIFVKANFVIFLSEHNITVPKVVHEKLASEIIVEVKANLTTF
jgi:polyisoprenoid-binding protein YceI